MQVKRQQLIITTYPGQVFSIAILPEGTRFLKWELAGGGNLDDILFDVIEEDLWGIDVLILGDVLHENRTQLLQKNELYIDNVRNATALVGIKIYAIVYE